MVDPSRTDTEACTFTNGLEVDRESLYRVLLDHESKASVN